MVKRIKILFTTSNFHTAGSGKVIYDLIKGLDTTKFDIEIACESRQGDFFKSVESLGLPIHIFETKTHYRPYVSLFGRVRKIAAFFKRNHYDIVHSWQWSSDWTEAVAAKLADAKWIYTKKAMGYGSRHWKIKSYLADYIITINDEMHSYFPNKNAKKLIPLGLETDYYRPEHFNKMPSDNFRIITVANLVPVKGLEILIQAIHKLSDPKIQLTVIGKNDNDYGLKMQALTTSLGLENHIFFVGKKMDVRPWITSSDLYIIPTLDKGRKEGMPMALVEAMSMGIPVLGSDIVGINYVLKDFKDLRFPAGDIQSLAKKILDIRSLNIQERERIGQELRHYCVANFSMSTFIASHEMLYSEIIQKRW